MLIFLHDKKSYIINKFTKENNAIENILVFKPKAEFDKFVWIIVSKAIK